MFSIYFFDVLFKLMFSQLNVPCEIFWEIDIKGNFKNHSKVSKIYVCVCVCVYIYIYIYNFKPLKVLILQK